MNAPLIPACPECGGPWLDGWRWAHVPLRRCATRIADDATQAADTDRAAEKRPPLIRPATANETRLWQLVTGTPLNADAVTVVHTAGGYWAREVGGHPNAADAAAATAALITTTDPEGTAA